MPREEGEGPCIRREDAIWPGKPLSGRVPLTGLGGVGHDTSTVAAAVALQLIQKSISSFNLEYRREPGHTGVAFEDYQLPVM